MRVEQRLDLAESPRRARRRRSARLNALRTRPSPCSDEFTPSNAATRSTISSATALIVVDPAGLGQVDERADVQAADRAVPVPAGGQAVAVEDLLEARDVVVQPLGRDRRVLDERERPAGAAAGGHQQPEPRLADLGERLLLGGGLGAQRVVAVAVAAPGALELVELGARLLGGVAEEGDEQQRRRGRPRSSRTARGTRAWSG